MATIPSMAGWAMIPWVGGEDNDLLDGQQGSDLLQGGGGNDTLYAGGGVTNDYSRSAVRAMTTLPAVTGSNKLIWQDQVLTTLTVGSGGADKFGFYLSPLSL